MGKLENIYNHFKQTSFALIKKWPVIFCFFFVIGVSMQKGRAQTLLPETSAKYRTTRQVLDRLTYVYANSRPQPELQLIARQSQKPGIIAQYQPGNQPLIQVSEEVYDVCARMGKDSLHALAVLLSHELAHHYEKHDWYYTFGIGNPPDNTSKEDIRRFEAEADFYGCFYGELAGFATGRVFPLIIDLVYQYFNLADQLQGYPSKEERKAIYQEKQKEASQMVAVFRAGQFLYLMQEFESAAQCFEYLLNRFPSREVLNNLSAAKLQQALVLYNNREQPSFVYPVELDARSRLVAVHRASPMGFNASKFRQLLVQARKYAEKAREIDPGYVPAYINLACIHSLGGNQAAAIGVINELTTANLTGNAYSIRAIAYYKDKQTEKAQKDFELAKQKRGYMANYNQALFHKLNESFIGSLTAWIKDWFEDDLSSPSGNNSKKNDPRSNSTELSLTSLPNQASQVKVSEKPYLLIAWEVNNHQWQLDIQAITSYYLVQYASENSYTKTVGGISPGTSYTVLIKQYGKPAYTFPGTRGEYWVYPHKRMAFEVGQHGRVINWLAFARK